MQASDQAALVLAAEVVKGLGPDAKVVLIPILRAGLSLLSAFWELLPQARVHHIGVVRDEQTALPQRYYPKEPRPINQNDCVIVLDPMLATGGSACDVLDEIKKFQPREIRLSCVIAAPEGIKKVTEAHPNVKIFTLAIDQGLDDRKYIVPGLGDYGDRYFGT